MSPDQYLSNILAREQVDSGAFSPVRRVAATLEPMLHRWGGDFLLGVEPSGSFAKGTGNRSGTDIDLFLTLSSVTPGNLVHIRTTLGNCLNQHGFQYRDQNVSLGINVSGFKVDLVPGRRQSQYGSDHSLFQKRTNGWTKTNIRTHISIVRNSHRSDEIRILKLWRDQKGFELSSFYLELMKIEALKGRPFGSLAENIRSALNYLECNINTRIIVDPANSNNIISDDLSSIGKQRVALAAREALGGSWQGLVK